MIQTSVGMDQDFTDTEPRAVNDSPKSYSELHTVPCRVELLLNSDTMDGPYEYRLLIEAPTFKAAHGILQAASARLFDTASRDLSNGE